MESLRISGVSISVESARALGYILLTNRSLKNLMLPGSNLNDESIEYISKGLKNNNTLQSLLLKRNCIGDRGAVSIAEMLKCNKSITNLNLCKNYITADGMIALANALAYNNTLKFLDLDDNASVYSRLSGKEEGIDEYAALAFIKALDKNTTLTDLYLDLWGLKDQSYKKQIKDLLARNKLLKESTEIDHDLENVSKSQENEKNVKLISILSDRAIALKMLLI